MIQERGSAAVTYEKLVLPYINELHLTDNYSTGWSSYTDSQEWSLSFTSVTPYKKEIKARYGDTVNAVLTYSLPEKQQGVSSYLPFTPNGDQFFCSRKQYGYRVSGTLTYKGKEYKLDNTPGAMGYGRSVWPYHTAWVWASASTYLSDGMLFGLNIGILPTKHSEATDDFITLGEKVIKLGGINSPEALLDSPGKWTFSTLNAKPTAQYGAFQATFTPDSTYNKDVNFWLISSYFKQVFGTFSGKVQYEGGEVSFKDVRGFLEVHLTRW